MRGLVFLHIGDEVQLFIWKILIKAFVKVSMVLFWNSSMGEMDDMEGKVYMSKRVTKVDFHVTTSRSNL